MTNKMNVTTVELPAFRPEDPTSPDDFVVEALRRMNATLEDAEKAAFKPAPLPPGTNDDNDITQEVEAFRG